MNRKIITQVFLFAAVGLVLLGCSMASSTDSTPSSDPKTSDTKYSVSIEFKWSAAKNPDTLDTYPSNAHFSPLVLSSHKSGKGFFAVGQKASPGVKIMAETGGTSTLLNELKTQSTNQEVHSYFAHSRSTSKGAEIVNTQDITVTKDFAYVSIATMIVPSPDWFIAPLTPIKLTDSSGNLKASATATLYGFDAGTENGNKFSLSNPATNPAVNIHRLGTTDAVKNFVWATVTLTKKK